MAEPRKIKLMVVFIETDYQGKVKVQLSSDKTYITIFNQGKGTELSLDIDEARTLAFVLIGLTDSLIEKKEPTED